MKEMSVRKNNVAIVSYEKLRKILIADNRQTCSSSTTSRQRLLYTTRFPRREWVPTIMSRSPFLIFVRCSSFSDFVWKLWQVKYSETDVKVTSHINIGSEHGHLKLQVKTKTCHTIIEKLFVGKKTGKLRKIIEYLKR